MRSQKGDHLPKTLFSLVIDTILKQLDLRGNIATRLKKYIAYVDNILLTTRTKQSLSNPFQEIKTSNAKLNPNRHLLTLFGAHHILHISRIRVKEISAQYGLIVKG